MSEGIDYPHGCRSGNCGGCKSHLISGEVEMSPYSPFALTDEERGRGLILACRSVPWSDCTVQPVEADEEAVHASRRLNCRVAGIDRATHDIRILSLEIESGGPFDFTAGQYAALAFEDLPPRDFSMASTPGAAQLEFHIRLVAGGQVTRHVLGSLRIGDRVSVNGPMGTAHYRKRPPRADPAGRGRLGPRSDQVDRRKCPCRRCRAGHVPLFRRPGRSGTSIWKSISPPLRPRHPNLRIVTVLSEPDAPTPRRTGWLADALAADFDDLDGFKRLSRRPSRDGGNLHRTPARARPCAQGLPRRPVLY